MLRWRWLSILLSLFLSLSGASDLAQATPQADSTKMNFWRVQRKGANNFNVHPDAEGFQAAKALGVDWVRLAYDKWPAQDRDFLLGNADHFTHLQSQDLTRLKAVLDMAQAADIKVVIAPLSLPGARWVQNNGDQPDLRLWSDKRYWQESARFWKSLAAALKDHPAVVGYNLINEPTPPETGLTEHGDPRRYADWYK
jgi:aryl-phospho-beta-D-glucosidase BglC (GH1 family)